MLTLKLNKYCSWVLWSSLPDQLGQMGFMRINWDESKISLILGRQLKIQKTNIITNYEALVKTKFPVQVDLKRKDTSKHSPDPTLSPLGSISWVPQTLLNHHHLDSPNELTQHFLCVMFYNNDRWFSHLFPCWTESSLRVDGKLIGLHPWWLVQCLLHNRHSTNARLFN